jgi:hypothetical protein
MGWSVFVTLAILIIAGVLPWPWILLGLAFLLWPIIFVVLLTGVLIVERVVTGERR